jgi:hypothetical protein
MPEPCFLDLFVESVLPSNGRVALPAQLLELVCPSSQIGSSGCKLDLNICCLLLVSISDPAVGSMRKFDRGLVGVSDDW